MHPFAELTIPLVLGQPADVAPQDAAPPPATDGQRPIESQDGTTDGPATGDQPQSPFSGSFFIIIMLALVAFWIFAMGGQRKEKKRRAAMLDALSKGDKVQTVGGIIGTVIEVRDSEVLVKIDENSNTRMRFARSAIQNVLTDEEK